MQKNKPILLTVRSYRLQSQDDNCIVAYDSTSRDLWRPPATCCFRAPSSVQSL